MIADGWKYCSLGDVLTLQRGFDLPERDRKKGYVPIVSSSGISGYHDVAKVSAPGVVTGRYGTLGEVFYIEEDYWPLNTTLYVRDFKGNDPRFLSYFLRTLNLEHQNTAGAVPGLNRNALHLLPVSIPPLPIQRKIAAILAAYDDLIENNMRRIAILEEMAQSLYREWFVHFRFPGHEKKSMVESALGMIPEGWEVVSLGDALTLQRGFDLPAVERCEGNVPVYAATGLNGTHNVAKVKGPGVLTGRSGSLGTVTYIHEDFWPLNTTLWIRDYRLVSPTYAFYLLSSIELKTFNSGAAVPTLNRNDVHQVTVIIPSREMIDEFDSFVMPLFKASKKLKQKNANLRQTRDLLLPKLISGEVDVEGLEIAGVANG